MNTDVTEIHHEERVIGISLTNVAMTTPYHDDKAPIIVIALMMRVTTAVMRFTVLNKTVMLGSSTASRHA